jgi:hypothetical protein
VPHELPERVGLEERRGVGHHEQLVAGVPDALVHRGPLSGARGADDDLDRRVVHASEDLVRPVGGAVRDDHDLEAIARVVELAEIRELVREVTLLVVGRDDERHRRQLAVAERQAAALAAAAEVAKVGPGLAERIHDEEHARIQQVRVGDQSRHTSRMRMS